MEKATAQYLPCEGLETRHVLIDLDWSGPIKRNWCLVFGVWRKVAIKELFVKRSNYGELATANEFERRV